MSFWGRLFGTEAALNATVESVSRGLDALVYTDEERATEAAKERSEARKTVVEWMQATQGQRIARRVIALSITTVWLSQYIVSQALSMAAIFSDNPEKLNEAARVAQSGAQDMNAPMMLILAFYFAAHHIGDFGKIALERFGRPR